MSEKLQKVLANAGHGSRREIEAMIKEGRVSVDGKLATLGDRVEVTPA
ncbi:S4 domain-containing protein, partial [Hafnia sp.]